MESPVIPPLPGGVSLILRRSDEVRGSIAIDENAEGSTKPDQDPSARLGSLISVVSLEQLDLVTDLLTEADLDTLKYLARKGTPANTLRALTSDLAYLEARCLAATDQVLSWPVPESLTLKYLAHHLYDAAERARDSQHGMLRLHDARVDYFGPRGLRRRRQCSGSFPHGQRSTGSGAREVPLNPQACVRPSSERQRPLIGRGFG